MTTTTPPADPLAWLAALAPDAEIERARWRAAVRAVVADVERWIEERVAASAVRSEENE